MTTFGQKFNSKLGFTVLSILLLLLAAAITFGILTAIKPHDRYATLRKGFDPKPLWSTPVAIEIDGDAQAFPPYALELGDSSRLGVVIPLEKGARLYAVNVKDGSKAEFYYQGKTYQQLDLDPCDPALVTKQPYQFDGSAIVCVLPSSQADRAPVGMTDDGQTNKSASQTSGNLFFHNENLSLVAFPNHIAVKRIEATEVKNGQNAKKLWSMTIPGEGTVGSDGYHIWTVSQGAQKDKPVLSYYQPQK